MIGSLINTGQRQTTIDYYSASISSDTDHTQFQLAIAPKRDVSHKKNTVKSSAEYLTSNEFKPLENPLTVKPSLILGTNRKTTSTEDLDNYQLLFNNLHTLFPRQKLVILEGANEKILTVRLNTMDGIRFIPVANDQGWLEINPEKFKVFDVNGQRTDLKLIAQTAEQAIVFNKINQSFNSHYEHYEINDSRSPRSIFPNSPEGSYNRAQRDKVARILAQNGNTVVQLSDVLRQKGASLALNNTLYHLMFPINNQAESIVNSISRKVKATTIQHYVVSLADTRVTTERLKEAIKRYPVAGLKSMMVINKEGDISSHIIFEQTPVIPPIIAVTSGTLIGHPSYIDNKDNKENQRAMRRENEAALILSNAGYNVAQNPETLSNGKNPDLVINGEIYDVFSPSGDRPLNIIRRVIKKVLVGQTKNVVINLADSKVLPADIIGSAKKWSVEGLKNIIIIDRFGRVLEPVTFKEPLIKS